MSSPAADILSSDLSLAAPEEVRRAIAAAALSLCGSPFRHQGRARATGMDCSGLCIVSGRLAGLPCLELEPDYRRRPSWRDFARSLPGMVIRVPGGLSQVEVGDVLLVGVGTRRLPLHCGVVVGLPAGPGRLPLQVVHSVEGQGVIRATLGAAEADAVLDVWRYRS